MTRAGRALPEVVLAIVLAVAPFVLPHLGGSFDMLQRTLVWGMLGLGFDLLFGATGLLSFGQAAFYGTGGFVAAYLLVNNIIGSVWLALLIGTIAAGLFGLVVGWLAVRRIGIYFAMITLAFGQMSYFLENSPLSAYTGGENGLPGVPVPAIGPLRFPPGLPMYGLLAAFFFVGFIIARRILHSPFGTILRGIKDNTTRVALVGHSVPAYKLAVFVIAALYAGLAGGLLGVFQSYMPPDAFSLDTSGQLVVQTVIGGVGTLIGPTIGAAIWLWLRDNLQAIPAVGALWKLILGVVFVALVIGLRRGIAGEIRHLLSHRRQAAADAGVPEEGGLATDVPSSGRAVADDGAAGRHPGRRPCAGGARRCQALRWLACRGWGVVRASAGSDPGGDRSQRRGKIHPVQDAEGRDQSHARRSAAVRSKHYRPGPTRTAQLGIGKSNQLNQLFLDMTVQENLRIAALARARGTFRADILRNAASIRTVEHQVDAVMETVGLTHRAEVPVNVLPYGEKRRLEIGIALATGPNVLLLDEPLAGMSPAERIATRALIREIGRGVNGQSRSLLIVEHDMDAIFELAERITVLYEGRLLADGTPDEIQRNQAVQDAYLGGMHELAHA